MICVAGLATFEKLEGLGAYIERGFCMLYVQHVPTKQYLSTFDRTLRKSPIFIWHSILKIQSSVVVLKYYGESTLVLAAIPYWDMHFCSLVTLVLTVTIRSITLATPIVEHHVRPRNHVECDTAQQLCRIQQTCANAPSIVAGT